MARITSEDARKKFGNNQFEFILAAAQRAREIKNGSAPRVDSKNGACITAIREIEQGKYTKEDYINDLRKKHEYNIKKSQRNSKQHQ